MLSSYFEGANYVIIFSNQACKMVGIYQGSHRLEKYLNLEGLLEY